MDEHVMTIHHEGGGSHSWWVGEGIWWLIVEGFGLVMTYDPMTPTEDDK